MSDVIGGFITLFMMTGKGRAVRNMAQKIDSLKERPNYTRYRITRLGSKGHAHYVMLNEEKHLTLTADTYLLTCGLFLKKPSSEKLGLLDCVKRRLAKGTRGSSRRYTPHDDGLKGGRCRIWRRR